MKIQLRTVLMVGAILLGGYLIASKAFLINQNPVVEEKPRPNPVGRQEVLKIGDQTLKVEVRRTADEQALGLSYRESLGENEGMAFVYAEPQRVLYWMKGMNFPLDFIWVARGIVVEMTESVPAPSEENPVPKTVSPATEVDMVVEAPSGWIISSGIKVGDEVSF